LQDGAFFKILFYFFYTGKTFILYLQNSEEGFCFISLNKHVKKFFFLTELKSELERKFANVCNSSFSIQDEETNF